MARASRSPALLAAPRSQALISKATLFVKVGRRSEARILLEGALTRARAGELSAAWWQGANNLAVLLENSDQYADSSALCEEGAAKARQLGNREELVSWRLGPINSLIELGR